MTETISAVSMTVTARARTSVPNGSPTRCAITSAWYTAANTEPSRATPATAAMKPRLPRKYAINRITQPNKGHLHVHQGVRAATMPMPMPQIERQEANITRMRTGDLNFHVGSISTD